MKNILFHEEVKDLSELIETVSNLDEVPELNEVKVGVICFIFDKEGKVVLNRRGPEARDDIGKLQALGGSINDKDADFRSAIQRELMEEAGVSDVNVTSFIGAIHDPKYDRNSNKMIDWIILAYVGQIGNEELKNMEPERCVGFEHIALEDINYNDMGDTAASFLEYIKNSGIR